MGVRRIQAALRHYHGITATVIQRLADHVTVARCRQVAQAQSHPGSDSCQLKTYGRQEYSDHVIRGHQT